MRELQAPASPCGRCQSAGHILAAADAVWDEPTSLRDKVPTHDDLRSFLPDMQVVFVDLGTMSATAFSPVPELEARIRTLQQIFRQPVTPEADLVLLTNDALQALLQKLENQLDRHPVP